VWGQLPAAGPSARGAALGSGGTGREGAADPSAQNLPGEQREQPSSSSCSLRTLPEGSPRPDRTQSLFSCCSVFAGRGFPREGMGGSAGWEPAPSPAAPSALPPRQPSRGPFAPRGPQIRAIVSPHCAEPELPPRPLITPAPHHADTISSPPGFGSPEGGC